MAEVCGFVCSWWLLSESLLKLGNLAQHLCPQGVCGGVTKVKVGTEEGLQAWGTLGSSSMRATTGT